MVKLIVYSFAVLGTALLFSCGDTTQATVTQSQPAANYLPSGKAGTVYTYNTTLIFNIGNDYDTVSKKQYLTILATDTEIPESKHAIQIERKLPYINSNSFAVDTLYYYTKDDTLFQYTHDFPNSIYTAGKILIGSVQQGDSISLNQTLGNTHFVTSVQEQVNIPYGTMQTMHLKYSKVSSSGTITELRTSDSYYGVSALRVKAHSLHTIVDNGKYTTYEDYTMELESVK